ncbi:hypothetical protein DPEC_G00374350 [Dallia pectoralis]|nr:hypothetical protein DPEC_G00374350 [Dallia pectoralis]
MTEILEKHQFELKIAGSAVHDLLSGKLPEDVDHGNAGADEGYVPECSDQNDQQPRGEAWHHHSTDGRHAGVEFTTDWQKDAERRDLTINSIYLGLDGTLYDFLQGYVDLKKRKVCFENTAIL